MKLNRQARAFSRWTMLGGLLLLSTGLGLRCPDIDGPIDNDNDNDNTVGDSGLTGKYVGSERCSQCHSSVHQKWSNTLHATAFETLEAIGQDENADCIGCHTVGFGEEGGFVNRATTNALAGVGCESCHGPGGDHVDNVQDESLRPPISISSSVCGTCHQGDHHPNFEDWETSKHAVVEPELVPRFAAGTSLNSCGGCHSGDFFYRSIIKGETVDDTLLQGKSSEEMEAITCVICHNPHAQTNNAATPDDGRDYQLRFPQVAYTSPSNSLADVQDPSRFNLCGQCHHARNRTWADSSREPHPSDQANVFYGEMPLPESDPTPIVPFRSSVHLNAAEQCSTCHVARKPFEEGIAPAVSGHTFEVNFIGCVDCHGTVEIAEAKLNALNAEIEYYTDTLREALDEWAADQNAFCTGLGLDDHECWEYTSEGGPPNDATGQDLIPDDIKKARFIYYYIIAGGGNGAHNPDYVREALLLAIEYAENAPDI